MAITAISISQDNKVNGSDLMPIHSPLIFIADVTYSDDTPDVLYCDVIENDEVLQTFSCIPYNDLLATVRQFAFVGTDILNGLMESFDDFQQLNNTLSFVEDITKEITLKFYDPDNEDTFGSTDVVICHGAAQFGEAPNFSDVYNNDDSVYYGADGEFVYIYFYNEDEDNILTIDSSESNVEPAQDYDDEIFTDYDDDDFYIDTIF